MTITIDCRWIDASGIGVYLQECLPFFLDSPHTFFLIGNAKRLSPVISGKNNAAVLDCPVKPFSIKEIVAFPKDLLKTINSCDCYYTSYFNIPGLIKIPVYTTIHDIIFPDMPELTTPLGLAARMWFYRRAFRKSAKIFTVSEFSKSRLDHYSHAAVPVVVAHSAIQPHLLNNKDAKKQDKKKILLFIGNIKKHKGLSILLEAFSLARQEGLDYRLVIAGSRENFRSREADFSAANGDSVEFTGFLSDDKLAELLRETSLLVQPSLYEGFCLPPLEALISGTPVLISDIPAHREIYSEYPQKVFGSELPVHWFKSGDVTDLKEKLLAITLNKKPQQIELAPELENLYTFKRTSRTILDTWETQ